jgi:predicted dehydrogenase
MAITRIRVGVLGLTHDHSWPILDSLAELATVELVAVAEPAAPLRQRFVERYGGTTAQADYQALLTTQSALAAMLIFADNRTSALLATQAAELGLHVMIEKPMAATLAQADRLAAAARRADIQLMINWPHHWNPIIREVHRLVESGVIGQVFKLRYCGGHAGPREIGCSPIFCEWLYDAERNGAGALIDQGGYAATICRWFLGQPQRVMAMAGRLTKTDITDLDNAVLLLRYPAAIAVAEASWSWVGAMPAPGPIVFGSEGTLVAHSPREPANISLIRQGEREPTAIMAPPLPAGERNPAEYFIDCIRSERPISGLISPAICRDAQEILTAAMESVRCGGEVSLPLDRALPGL